MIVRSFSTKCARSGRGPTKLISPLSTLMSCGISSRRSAGRSPPGASRGLRVHAHAAELEEREGPALLPHPLLTVEHGSQALEADEDGEQPEQRRDEREEDESDAELEDALRLAEEPRLVEPFREDEP